MSISGSRRHVKASPFLPPEQLEKPDGLSDFSRAYDLHWINRKMEIVGRVWGGVDFGNLISDCDRIPEKWNDQISVWETLNGKGETGRDRHVASSARPRPAFHLPGCLSGFADGI